MIIQVTNVCLRKLKLNNEINYLSLHARYVHYFEK